MVGPVTPSAGPRTQPTEPRAVVSWAGRGQPILGVTRRTSLMDWRSALKRKGLVHGYDERWYITTR